MEVRKLQLIAGGRRRLEERALVACFEDPEIFERLLRQLAPACNGSLGLVSEAAGPAPPEFPSQPPCPTPAG
jgi:hypothetical protein